MFWQQLVFYISEQTYFTFKDGWLPETQQAKLPTASQSKLAWSPVLAS
jgi:hypothetical protein